MAKKRKRKPALCAKCVWNVEGGCIMHQPAYPKATTCEEFVDETSEEGKELAADDGNFPSAPNEGLRPAAKDGREIHAHFETTEFPHTAAEEAYYE